MTVYIVAKHTWMDDCDQDILGVFDNEEAAKACLKAYVKSTYWGDEGEIEDDGTYYRDSEWMVEIHECDTKKEFKPEDYYWYEKPEDDED